MKPPRKLFWVITSGDFTRSFKWARTAKNDITEQIKMKLHPENPTPGMEACTDWREEDEKKKPITQAEILNLVHVTLNAIKWTMPPLTMNPNLQVAYDKLEELKKRL